MVQKYNPLNSQLHIIIFQIDFAPTTIVWPKDIVAITISPAKKKMPSHFKDDKANNDRLQARATHQIFALNNNTILRAYNTLDNTSFPFIFAPDYHHLQIIKIRKWKN